jgi:hypothetical protein
VTISLYANYVITAGAVLCVDCAVATVKRFADTCYKSKEDIAKDIICFKNKKSVQRHKEVIISLIKVKLRRF